LHERRTSSLFSDVVYYVCVWWSFSQPKESTPVNSAALNAVSLIIAKIMEWTDLRREFLKNYFAKFANLLLDLLSETNCSCQVTLSSNKFDPWRQRFTWIQFIWSQKHWELSVKCCVILHNHCEHFRRELKLFVSLFFTAMTNNVVLYVHHTKSLSTFNNWLLLVSLSHSMLPCRMLHNVCHYYQKTKRIGNVWILFW
jgi:hypothetical protein